MKITHIITGLQTGGAERNLSNIIQWSGDKYSHEVIVLTKNGPIANELMEKGIAIKELNFPRGKLTASGLLVLFRKLLRSKTDVIQTWMYHSDLVGGVLAKLTGHRNIFWNIRLANLEDASLPYSSLLTARASAMISRFIPRNIVINSESGRIIHEKMGYMGSKFVVIPNGFDTEKYSKDITQGLKVRSELRIPTKNMVYIKVARYDPQKQHQSLLEAMRGVVSQNENSTLLLVGRGCSDKNQQLNKIITEYGLEQNVRLIGEQSNVVPYLSGADCYVSSSSAEGLPNSVAEAMSCELPCVVTDAGDSAHLIQSTGITVPIGDTKQLARGMSQMMQLKQTKRSQLGTEARERIIQNFSKEMTIQRYDSLWQRAA